jgi:hypothetical protein
MELELVENLLIGHSVADQSVVHPIILFLPATWDAIHSYRVDCLPLWIASYG